MNKVLVPHLSRETYRNLAGKYEDGEYSHGAEGLWEYFGDVLNITGKEKILEELEKMLHEKWLGRNDPCFCGSADKFKNCHLKKWQELIPLGNGYLLNGLAILKDDFQSQRDN